jgi:hypothetical protein
MKRIRWSGHAACSTREKRNTYTFLGEDCVKMDLELFTGLICNVEFPLCVFVINCVINYDLSIILNLVMN